MVSTLELRGISKRFGAKIALHDVNLTLHAGEILAIVGENGAGKSTLMKILSGVQTPDAGSISLDGEQVQLRDPWDARQRGISIIHQEFSLVPHLDVTDNLFLGRERTNAVGARAKRAMRRESEAVLARLRVDFPIDSMVGRLGVAQQQFVEIAKALLTEPRVLIMDEPTATLTTEESQRLLAIIRDLAGQSVAVIFISHHLDEVFEIADTIMCLRDGERVGERKTGEWSREELIRMMVGRDLNTTLFHASPRRKEPVAKQDILLDVRGVRRKPHLPENSFQIHRGEILGIAGLVGAGRTKMIRAIIGADRSAHHDVTLRGQRLRIHSPADARRAGIGLVPEDRKDQGLVMSACVRENLLLASWKKFCHPLLRYVRTRRTAEAVQEQIHRLRIKTSSPQQITGTLSGGNQQKVVLGKWLIADCSVLILDEPTRGIDVGAKGEIYALLRELSGRGIAILLISSEIPEVIAMSDRVMVMRHHKIVHVFASGEAVTEEAIMSYAAGGACA